MVPSIMHQVLHNPKFAKLDLASIESMGSGAAYMPPDLRVDFERRVKKAPIFIEGSCFPYHQWPALITVTLQDTGCLNVYDPFCGLPVYQRH
jgi:hypothetical protein